MSSYFVEKKKIEEDTISRLSRGPGGKKNKPNACFAIRQDIFFGLERISEREREREGERGGGGGEKKKDLGILRGVSGRADFNFQTRGVARSAIRRGIMNYFRGLEKYEI